MARPRAHEQRHQLRGLVLNQEVAGAAIVVRSGLPCGTVRPSGANARRHGLDAKHAKALGERLPYARAFD